MKSGNLAMRSIPQLANRSLVTSVMNGGVLARASFLLILLGLAIISFYSPSSASAPANPTGQAAEVGSLGLKHGNFDSRLGAIGLSRSNSFINGSLLAPLPPPFQGSIATFASDCTTAKTEFTVGETVCVKVTGITVSPSFPRHLTWAAPDSTVVKTTDITSDPQSDSLLINATSVVNGRTIDNRGTWQLSVRNPFFFFPEASASFTVTDPQNTTADLGVSVTAGSNNVAAGSQAVFHLQVNNYGPNSSTNAQLTTDVPANATFVSFQQLNGPIFTCVSPNVGDTGTTTCSLASLDWPDNSVATFIATYQVDNGVSTGTEISNTANVASVATQSTPATADQNDRNDSATSSETVAAAPCVITCPSNIDVPADSGQAGAVVTYSTPSSTGDCGQPVTGEGGEVTPAITCSPASGSFFAAGTTTVICSGQTNGVCTFQVTVENPGGLSITLNGANPFALECGDDFTDPGATAVNGSGQSVPVTVSGTLDNHTPGSYTLTYTATEDPNSTSTTRTVNVSDSAGPVITIAGSNPLTLSCGQTFVDPGVSADDACEGSKSVTSSGTVNSNVPGNYTITYSASDSANHTSTATRTVTVEAGGGTAPPTITLNGDPQMTVECGSFTDPGATATVPCGGSVPVTVSGTVPNTPGTYTLTYTACVEDSPGHCDPARTSHVDRTVIVEDNTAPTITVDGANPMTVECHSSFTDPGATAHDGCAGNFPATASGSVNTNAVGQYTITYNATDPSGHAAAAVTRTVNVVDTTAPVITTCPAAQSANANSSCQAVVPDFTGSAAASDLCGSGVTITQSPAAGAVVGVGNTTITITAKDSFNNSSTCTTTFTVVAPQLSSLGSAQMWVGLKNSDDVGTKFDLLAEVLRNGVVVGSGEVDGVSGGSSGFNNAIQDAITMAVSGPASFCPTNTLSIRLSVRVAANSGHVSGTARLWFNDSAANSRFTATINGTANTYYLTNVSGALVLSTSTGTTKVTIDVLVNRNQGGNPFKPFGTWGITF